MNRTAGLNIESEIIDTVQARIVSADSLGGENPLIVMGLSPDITELGLEDNDLWEYCRAISRWLLAHFHPDRCKDRESVLLQQRYADAFELLKDREVFNKSLEDFKKKMRWQRSEVNGLIKTGSELRRSREDAVSDLKKANRRLKEVQGQLRGLWGRFAKYVNWHPGRIKSDDIGFQVCPPQSVASLALIRFIFHSVSGKVADRHGLKGLLADYKDKVVHNLLTKSEAERIRRDFRVMNGRVANVKELFDQARISAADFPEVYWGDDAAMHKRGFDKLVKTRKPKCPSSIDGSGFRKADLKGAREAFMDIFKLIASWSVSEVEYAEVGLRFHSVGNCSFVFRGRPRQTKIRVIGSVRLEDILPEMIGAPAPSLTFEGGIDLEKVLPFLDPMVVRGNFLVTVYEDSSPRSPDLPRCYVNHYILAVR